MNVVEVFGVLVAGLCLGVAVVALRLAWIPRWRGMLTVAAGSVAAAGYQLCDVAFLRITDPALGPILFQVQVLFSGMFVGSMLSRRAVAQSRPPARPELAALGGLAGTVLVLLVPGLSVTGAQTREVAWLDIRYLEASFTALGSGAIVVLMGLLGLGLWWLEEDRRRGGQPLLGTRAAIVVLMLCVGLDQLSHEGVLPLPYVVGFGLIIQVVGMLWDFGRQMTADTERLIRLQGVLEDVARERATELREAREELSEQTRFTLLGELAAGIAHEINNPASTVVHNLVSIRASESLSVDGGEAVDDALSEARRISNLVRRLVRSTDPAQAELRPSRALPLREHVRRAVTLVEETTGVVIVSDVDESLLVQGDAEVLELILEAVVRAAVKALPRTDPSPLVELVAVAGEERVELLVSTDAPGGGVDAGTEVEALGDTVSYGLLRGMGGEIEVLPSSGSGRRVRLTLRRARSSWSAVRPVVLVVDDERPVRDGLRRALARSHRVVTAGSVAEATQLLRSIDAPELILCDVMMPGQSGDVLFQVLEEHHPQLVDRLAYMSGGVTGEARGFMATWRGPLLHKPFGVSEVRALLARRDGGRTSPAAEQ